MTRVYLLFIKLHNVLCTFKNINHIYFLTRYIVRLKFYNSVFVPRSVKYSSV